jgi:hypothetical protein
MALQKWAVDSAAKKYWEEYYREYGRSWVRDIPRRIRAAVKTAAKSNAIAIEAGLVTPIGTTWDDESVYLEGVFRPATGPALLFNASFSHEGKVTSFDAIPLEAAKDTSTSKSK